MVKLLKNFQVEDLSIDCSSETFAGRNIFHLSKDLHLGKMTDRKDVFFVVWKLHCKGQSLLAALLSKILKEIAL